MSERSFGDLMTLANRRKAPYTEPEQPQPGSGSAPG